MKNSTLKKPSDNKAKKINQFISEQRSAFKIPANTVKDGADKLPTVQEAV